MKQLEERILRDGKILPGGILKVGSFLNQQIDTAFLREMGQRMGWFDAGARNLYTRVPVSTLRDLKGLTIRVQESALMSEMIRLWGAVPVQMVYSEVYSALETGRIDGAENNWPSYETTGHFEAAPYYLLDAHFRLPEAQIISQVTLDKLNALDPSYEELVFSCARESALYERKLWQEREQISKERVQRAGCVVTELSEEEKDRFRKALQPMYEGFSEPMHELIMQIRGGGVSHFLDE